MTGYRLEPEKLPPILPVFPLTGVLLLPGGQLPLNIFEPRYLAMVRDALASEARLIGMVQPRVPDPTDNHGPAPGTPSDAPEIYAIGCAGRVVGFNETPDGRNLITLHGITRFRITEETALGDGYRRVKAGYGDFSGDLNADEAPVAIDRDRLLEAVKKFFEARRIDAEWEQVEKTETGRLVTSLAMSIPFSPVERQALLESASADDRAALLITMMEMAAAAPEGEGGISH